jgi:hypothetical protein
MTRDHAGRLRRRADFTWASAAFGSQMVNLPLHMEPSITCFHQTIFIHLCLNSLDHAASRYFACKKQVGIGGAAMFKNIEKIMVAAFCLAVVWLVTAPAVHADDWDKATRIR